jgi:endonuclease/exonuclease/phosphatase family metal-dependent hydrolase
MRRVAGGRGLGGVITFCVLVLSVAGAERVRVATFNVNNYLAMDRRVEGRFRPEYPKTEDEKTALRSIIREIAPDVLALQEIGDASYLEELRRDLIVEGWEFPYSHLLEAGDAERHVAVLSRLPFVRVTPHAALAIQYFGGPEPVKRGLLEITFTSGSDEWTLFVVHLKSRYTDRSEDPLSATRRLLEARAVRDRVLERFPDPANGLFLIAGDCNDTPDSKPLSALQERGATAICRAIPATDSRGETWTHFYRRADSYSRVDYLLASPALWPRVVGGRAVIHDGASALAGSDHRLVWVELEFELSPSDG